MSDVAEFCYKCMDVYDPTNEGGIPYDDPTVNVQWPNCGCEHKTSAKDKEHEPFAEQKFDYFANLFQHPIDMATFSQIVPEITTVNQAAPFVPMKHLPEILRMRRYCTIR